MIKRSGPDVAQRLLQTSLYRPISIWSSSTVTTTTPRTDCSGTTRRTATGLVEPMRTEDEHQRQGLARHILTTGVDLLSDAGAARYQDLLRTRQRRIEGSLPQRRFRTGQSDRHVRGPNRRPAAGALGRVARPACRAGPMHIAALFIGLFETHLAPADWRAALGTEQSQRARTGARSTPGHGPAGPRGRARRELARSDGLEATRYAYDYPIRTGRGAPAPCSPAHAF